MAGPTPWETGVGSRTPMAGCHQGWREGGLMPGTVLVAQSCLTLCDSTDCSPPGSSVYGDAPGKNTAAPKQKKCQQGHLLFCFLTSVQLCLSLSCARIWLLGGALGRLTVCNLPLEVRYLSSGQEAPAPRGPQTLITWPQNAGELERSPSGAKPCSQLLVFSRWFLCFLLENG